MVLGLLGLAVIFYLNSLFRALNPILIVVAQSHNLGIDGIARNKDTRVPTLIALVLFLQGRGILSLRPEATDQHDTWCIQ